MNAVNICNLALSLLGDSANVSSIDPPEGSVQAEQCARFYPIALTSLLESHPWTFATKRERLARLSATSGQWRFAYSKPSKCLRVLRVVSPDRMPMRGVAATDPAIQSEHYEMYRIGDTEAILTNIENAEVHFITSDVKTGMFSPMFRDALALRLAVDLAGTIVKGKDGRDTRRALFPEFQIAFSRAAAADSNQRRIDLDFIPESMMVR